MKKSSRYGSGLSPNSGCSERRRRAAADHVVDHERERPRLGQADRRRRDRQGERDDDELPVGTQIREDALGRSSTGPTAPTSFGSCRRRNGTLAAAASLLSLRHIETPVREVQAGGCSAAPLPCEGSVMPFAETPFWACGSSTAVMRLLREARLGTRGRLLGTGCDLAARRARSPRRARCAALRPRSRSPGPWRRGSAARPRRGSPRPRRRRVPRRRRARRGRASPAAPKRENRGQDRMRTNWRPAPCSSTAMRSLIEPSMPPRT